jgi:hypothetical protein
VSDDPPKPSRPCDAELERQIRAERKFTLAEAVGRLAGPGALKGASPVDRRKQAAAQIEEYLERNLADNRGALSCVLLRHVAESKRLLDDLDHPLVVLCGYVRHVLSSEYRLKELVRDADAEWGRVFDERPCFEIDGCPPAADDPYTLDSVRAALSKLASGMEK